MKAAVTPVAVIAVLLAACRLIGAEPGNDRAGSTVPQGEQRINQLTWYSEQGKVNGVEIIFPEVIPYPEGNNRIPREVFENRRQILSARFAPGDIYSASLPREDRRDSLTVSFRLEVAVGDRPDEGSRLNIAGIEFGFLYLSQLDQPVRPVQLCVRSLDEDGDPFWEVLPITMLAHPVNGVPVTSLPMQLKLDRDAETYEVLSMTGVPIRGLGARKWTAAAAPISIILDLSDVSAPATMSDLQF